MYVCASILTSHLRTMQMTFNDISSMFQYRGADKSLARPTSRCILFEGENISFDASLVLCVCVVCVYVYIYIHTVCVYIYIYIYTHTVVIFLQL
jgi:hypothetical protein